MPAIGTPGFEPRTFATQRRRATRLRYVPCTLNGRACAGRAHEAAVSTTSSGRVHPSVHFPPTRLLDDRWTADWTRVGPIVKLACTALLACIALGLPGSASAASSCADAGTVPSAENVAAVKSATLCLLNRERTSRGLPRLSANRQLAKAAQRHSANMVRHGFFDHVSPSGSTLNTRVKGGTSYLRGAVRSWSLAENIAWGSGELASPRQIVRSWMSSAGHRRNILERRFRHIGIGVATGAPGDAGGRPAATYTTDFGARVVM